MLRSIFTRGRFVRARSCGWSRVGSFSSSSMQTEPAKADQSPSTIVVDIPANAQELTPARVVEFLDKFVIGQQEGKRAIAVALRNRWRRQNVTSEFLRSEIIPKNILMVGPTGVGKTELARRMAKFVNAPFVKVEATQYTEVGYHGKDVDTMIRDLVSNSITLTKQRLKERYQAEINTVVENKLLAMLAKSQGQDKETLRPFLQSGALDECSVEMEKPPSGDPLKDLLRGASNQPGQATFITVDTIMKSADSARKQSILVSEARKILSESALSQIVNDDTLRQSAVKLAEEEGIVFIDEIDKVCFNHMTTMARSGDASNEGVQRDLLPLVEGCVVDTKYGEVNTSKILFIASGAFHAVKVSDILPELQGRMPVRVKLNPLTEDDMYRILTEPAGNLVVQHQALLQTEGLDIKFEESGLRRIAAIAAELNQFVENIGARRLSTVTEKILESISFDAEKLASENKAVVVDRDFVDTNIGDLLTVTDLKKFIL